MDEIVEAALRKWPNVPHCHGWLGLDARGDWYLRDEVAQAAGSFLRSKGSRIEHAKLRDFIGRNYGCDAQGCWYFQNGPQRVYVDLEAAPWVWRLHPGDTGAPGLLSHTGLPALVESAWLDQHGRLFLATSRGFGLVHSLDMEIASTAIERGEWTPRETSFEELPVKFGYRLAPRPGP